VSRKVRALDLWRKMLTMLFETGHPWVTFKDPCNIRSPQGHVGVVHSSNLCTEITLNTSKDEVAVCNLGSVNLVNHVTEKGLDLDRLAKTVGTAMRMLDNVIDINFYTIPEARRSNLQHRPVGLGLMGFQDALQTLRIPYASDAASNSPTGAWRRSAITRFRRRSISPPSVAATRASTARCGRKASCRSTRSSCSRTRPSVDMDKGSTLDWDSCAAK
jgi:ribonucleoside-diphosphate reductase alpha chain